MAVRVQGLECEEVSVPRKGSTGDPEDDRKVLYLDFGDHFMKLYM